MADEGLITPVKTEQEGNLPARTIYDITDRGRSELDAHRDEAFMRTKLSSDPVDLALSFTEDMTEEQVRALVTNRRRSFAAQVIEWQDLQKRVHEYLSELERAVLRHTVVRLEAEIAWHDELLERLPALLESHRKNAD
jgi:DNA-binding PadR family transcriptional regulator